MAQLARKNGLLALEEKANELEYPLTYLPDQQEYQSYQMLENMRKPYHRYQQEEMAQLARKNGLLALEEKANELDDMFFKQGITVFKIPKG